MLLILISILMMPTKIFSQEKIYVIEREKSKLTIIKENSNINKIKNIGNLNHATIKFNKNKAFLLSRNGYLSKLNIKNDKLIKKIKVGNSSIGFSFFKNKILISNYDPKTISIVNKNLYLIKEIITNSKNVGIKKFNKYIIFSLMDKNELWIINSKKNFTINKKIKNIGQMPFDALIYKTKYIIGLFKENSIGFFQFENEKYKKIKLKTITKNQNITKIPHFGSWGINNKKNIAYIPSSTENKINIVDLNKIKNINNITLIGLPIFISLSKNNKYICINYSGPKENFLTLIKIKNQYKNKIEYKINNLKIGNKILHTRFSQDCKKIYFSSYNENLLKILNIKNKKIKKTIKVKTPSGIFIPPNKKIYNKGI